MKTALTFFASLALVAAAYAQTAVTFAVDMNDVAEFDPTTDTLRVAGSFQQPNNWTPRAAANDNILTDPDGNGVYSVTYMAMPGDYEFKYVINIWAPDGFNEDGGTSQFIGERDCLNSSNNRPLTVGSDAMMTPIYKYNSCEVSTLSSVRDLTPLAGVRLSPNPVIDQATLTLPDNGSYVVRVMSADGRIVSEAHDVQATSYAIDRNTLPGGLYLVEVLEASKGQRAVVRMSVQ